MSIFDGNGPPEKREFLLEMKEVLLFTFKV